MNLLSYLSILPMGIFIIGEESGAHWDWQLTHPYDYNLNVQILILDAIDPTKTDIAALRDRGVRPYCYISVGTWESYRPDKDQFPAEIIGKPPGDWPDENYLDIRRTDVLLPIMKARIDACAAKGFVGIEPDNMDIYINDSGFPITSDHVIEYISALADYAHEKRMVIGQKNAPGLTAHLIDKMDYVLVEGCFEWDFCDEVAAYAEAGKDVLAVEYAPAGLDWEAICDDAKRRGYHLLLKEYEVTAGGKSCQ